ncbi:MAG TPA: YciI family protein [Mycobacterium sp.]
MTEPGPVGSSREAWSLFLFRLIPPRADFAQTMTDDEQQAMAQHMAYWKGLLAQGRVVVYGPVADPEGVWGMGVLRAADRAEVLAIAERDPSVTAGVNTFEVFEIMGGTTG